ncbi:RES family NAD+ phosphorylase [Pseudoalteromonas sp. SR44-8]|uniref:RES family NAD+ phosphorylase n=1 Tax=Pseudoalteromonas sp. SR44-8 TaxID=2760933 RepID=UPI001600C7FB|nr:RES family NAD+ phosphorylase [Pseudoalteromonas sp. SR44-8]MBB1300615.1 RES family NAD+ phosphorylase [Pseudoalteromonas sp. SR44-8]
MENFTERFNIFCKEVCEENRFFYSQESNCFLNDFYEALTADSKKFVQNIPSGSTFYRARSHVYSSIDNAYKEEPFNCDEMKPVPNIRSSGRLNAYNVNALYLASDKGTAISEVRANAEAPISVAQFKTNKELKIARFDYISDVDDWYSLYFPKFTYFLAHRFSLPLDAPEHQAREYIPTQIISEFLKSKGIDGIEYPSQFISSDKEHIEGKSADELLKTEQQFNLCLFDITTADCIPESIEVLQLSKRINIISKFKGSN